MKLLDNYLTLQKQIYDYFGYTEDWRVFPIDDCRDMYWRIEDLSSVRFCEAIDIIEAEKILNDEEGGNYWEDDIYTYRHLDKHIFSGKDFTMCLLVPHADGNIFLRIFSNDRRLK